MIGKKKVKLILFVCLAVIFLIMAMSGIGREIFDPEHIRTFVMQTGAIAPLVFAGLFMLIVLVGLPPTLMTTTSGVIFGPLVGLVISTICVNLGGLLIFVISRRLGRNDLKSYLSTKFSRLERGLEVHGFLAVVIARLSFVPFALVCVTAALSSVKKRDFLAGTLIGTFPAIFMLTWLGDAALMLLKSGDLTVLYQWQGIVSVTLFAIAFIVPIVYEKYKRL